MMQYINKKQTLIFQGDECLLNRMIYIETIKVNLS
jgi:hypothetical protein